MRDYYSSLEIHQIMLQDDLRNRAYRDALFSAVKPGQTVLDFGTGSGILSLFAAQAGARRVYALERTSIARLARALAARNGFHDVIRVFNADALKVRPPEKVDIIVSEWLGTYGVDENLLATLCRVRDRWLKPNGMMLPGKITAWLAPALSRQFQRIDSFKDGKPYGLDLRPFRLRADDAGWTAFSVSPRDLLAPAQLLWTTDVYASSFEQAQLPCRASRRFTAQRAGRINAAVAWFEAEFAGGFKLSNAPDESATHWGQFVAPLDKELAVAEGDEIAVAFSCLPADPGRSHTTWSVRVGSGPWEHHDTRLTNGLVTRGRGIGFSRSTPEFSYRR